MSVQDWLHFGKSLFLQGKSQEITNRRKLNELNFHAITQFLVEKTGGLQRAFRQIL